MQYVAEHVEPYSYLKYPYLKKVGWKGFVDGMDSGVYKATPLSRLNVADGMATPLAQAEYERYFETLTGDRTGKTPVHSTLATHWARVVELMFACEATLEQAKDEEITSDQILEPPTGIVGEGVGIVEAPRGTLTHHYKTDQNGIVTEANLIVGTTNNNAPITMSIKRAAEGLDQEGYDDYRRQCSIGSKWRSVPTIPVLVARPIRCRARCRWRLLFILRKAEK